MPPCAGALQRLGWARAARPILALCASALEGIEQRKDDRTSHWTHTIQVNITMAATPRSRGRRHSKVREDTQALLIEVMPWKPGHNQFDLSPVRGTFSFTVSSA